MGWTNLCLAVAGKDNYPEFAQFLEKAGLRYEILQVEGVVRENLTLRSDGETVKLNRKGLSMSTMLVGALMALIQSRLHPGDIVVFGGSLPENITVQDYAELILAVKKAGALVAVDSDLLTLEHYRRIAPWLIKPNIHELRHILDVKGNTIADVAEAARVLNRAGRGARAWFPLGETACCAPPAARRTGWKPVCGLRFPRWRSNPPWGRGTARWQALL